MAATPIYDEKPSKIFFSGTKGPMTLGLDMSNWGLGPIKIFSNDDLGLTLTYFMARSNLVPYAFIWEKLLDSHLMEETYSKWLEWHEVYVYIKILTPGGLSAPAPGLEYSSRGFSISHPSQWADLFAPCNPTQGSTQTLPVILWYSPCDLPAVPLCFHPNGWNHLGL